MGFPMQICSVLRTLRFSWSILVTHCVHLRTSSSKTQMLLVEKNISHKYWLFCYRFNQPLIWPDSGLILHHQYGISVAESQTFLLPKTSTAAKWEEKRLFSQASWREIGRRTSGKSLSPLGARHNDLGAASQALLRRVRLRLLHNTTQHLELSKECKRNCIYIPRRTEAGICKCGFGPVFKERYQCSRKGST